MEDNGITGKTQDVIVQSITSFALYGFPESHAASFALLAYASAYLKCHYLAAFTTAILNNQPMGFYAPATLVKDAQKHGQHFKPVDITSSDWLCSIEEHGGEKWVRLGLNYVRGLTEQSARAIVDERGRRPFASIQDLVNRVPILRKDELARLGEVGALNFLQKTHRRGAMWETELAARPAGPLFESQPSCEDTPLAQMDDAERLTADYIGIGLTIGRHPMAYHREQLNRLEVTPANRLLSIRNGRTVRATCLFSNIDRLSAKPQPIGCSTQCP